MSADTRAISDGDVTHNADLPADHAIAPDARAAADARLGRNYGVFTDLHIVGYLHEVIELHPTADGRSDVANWQQILRNLASGSPVTVVPGHGVFAAGNGAKPLLELDRYFETMRARIRAMRDAGKSLEEIKTGVRAELGEFAKWPRERAIPATAEQVYRELTAR